MSNKSFFRIMPRSGYYLDFNIDFIRLRVILEGGVDVSPDLNLNVTDLNEKNGILYKQFHNSGYGGVSFKVSVIIGKDEQILLTREFKDNIYDSLILDIQTILAQNGNFNGDYTKLSKHVKITDLLDYWIRNNTPLMVNTDAIDIPDGIYIITKNSSRKQTHDKYTIWDLEFLTYNEAKAVVYKNDNARVKNAIEKAKAKQVAAKTSKSKPASTYKTKFAKCKRSVLKYSKKKKTVTCVKYLQKILKKQNVYKGNIDSWFGPMTRTAVKKFQKKYKKKYKLKKTGKVDKKTFNALKKV